MVFPVQPTEEDCPPSEFHEIKQAVVEIADLRVDGIKERTYTEFDFWEDLRKYTTLTLKQATRIHESILKVDQKIVFMIRALQDHVTQVVLNNEAPHWTELRWLFHPELRPLFSTIYDSSVTGLEKPEKQAFLQVAHELMIVPYECVMIDDRLENVKAAEKVGMQGYLYTDAENLREFLERDFEHVIRKHELIHKIPLEL